ncbi:MAG: MarR family winged helix-turn-helix transcriptional regulator [Aestuariivirga sp.]
MAAGDELVGDLGLTSARWQVLGAIELAPYPLPVAHIAFNMGLSRQAVQRIAKELASCGMIDFADNPRHVRAKLVITTAKGKQAFASAMKRQKPWATRLGARLKLIEIETAVRVMRNIRQRLETSESTKGRPDHESQEHA